MTRFFSEQPLCLAGIASSGSAHYGAPRAERIRHTVRLMAAEAVVKPYVRSQENDANDAEGTCEPIMRPNMRVAPQKSVDQ